MKLYVVSVRTKVVALLSIVAFIMIAVVSSADLSGKGQNKVDNHFKSDELKMQDAAAEQLVSIVNPKMSTKKEVLYTLVAAAVIGVEYEINDPIDYDHSSNGDNDDGF